MRFNKIIFIVCLVLLCALSGCKKTDNNTNIDDPALDTKNVSLEKDTYKIGEKIIPIIEGYDSYEDFDVVVSDKNTLTINDNYVIASSEGSYYIIYVNKNDSEDLYWFDITIEGKITFDNISITLNREEYVPGEVLDFNIDNYDFDDLDFSFDDKNAFNINANNTISVRRFGEYQITATLKLDKSVTTTFDIIVYSKSFDLSITTSIITINDTIKCWIYNYDNMKETSVDDFIFTINNEDVASIDGNTLTALNYGTVSITVTSKYNALVTKSIDVTIADPTNTVMLRFEDGDRSVAVGEICTMVFSGNANPEDYNWMSSNNDVVRVTKYDTCVQIMGISEGETTIMCVNKQNSSMTRTYYVRIENKVDVDYISIFLNRAYGEVGVVETGENFQKYGEWYGNNGQPWCATFVSWCWWHSGLTNDLLLKYQGCTTGMEWCVEQGIFHYKESYMPKSGDIVFYLSSGMSHTGIVAYADSSYIYTIEGNNSNKVGVWRWSLDDKHITGYASPNYPSYNGTREDFSWIATTNTNGVYLWTDYTTKSSVL